MSLSNREIYDLAKLYALPLRACCMKDELARLSPVFGGYVVNLMSSTQGNGSHWCLLVLDPDGAVYCDPFGAPPPVEVSDFYERTRMRSGYNATIIQALDSHLCGWYALGLMIYIKQHHSARVSIFNTVNDFINLFEDDTARNGAILKRFYRAHKPNAFVKRRLLAAHVK